MFGVLFPGQLQQVLEGELAVDLGLVIPAPPRYHARVTPPGRSGGAGWRRVHRRGLDLVASAALYLGAS